MDTKVNTNTVYTSEVIKLMQVGVANRVYVDAIYLGQKIKLLELPEIRKHTDMMVWVMQRFFGHYGDTAQLRISEIKKDLPTELQFYFGEYTIQEIELGFNRALRSEYGTYNAVTPSLKLVRDLIHLYLGSQVRKEVKAEYGRVTSEHRPDTTVLSDDDKEQLTLQNIAENFAKYKAGADPFISFMTYDYLAGKGCAPDYRQHVTAAGTQVLQEDRTGKRTYLRHKDPDTKKITLSDELARQFSSGVERTAKILAIRTLYDGLIAMDSDILTYIKDATKVHEIEQ